MLTENMMGEGGVRVRQETETLSERVAVKVRQYVTENEMRASDRFPNELQMAEYYEVGRGTVRDVIKPLWFEGLMEVVQSDSTYLLRQKQESVEISGGETPNLLGAFLSEEPPNKTLEFSEIRLVLKPDIATLAATNMTYKDCRKLMGLEVEVCWQIQTQESHYEKGMEFRLQIARCSRNEVACRLMEIVVKGIPLFCKVTSDELANQTVKFHHMVLEPIERGDTSGARYNMIDYLNSIRREVIEEIEQQKAGKSSNDF